MKQSLKMTIKYLVLFTITVLFTLYISMKQFDLYLAREIFNWPNNNDNTSLIFDNPEGINPHELIENLIVILDKYEVDVYQPGYSTLERALYVHSSDERLFDKVLLFEGNVEDLKSFDVYTNYSKDPKTKMFSTLPPSLMFSIRSIRDLDHHLRVYQGPYILDNFDKNDILGIKEEFKTLYPTLTVIINELSHQSEFTYIDTTDIIMVSLIGLLLVMVINTDILKELKKSSIMRIEGYSTSKIYLGYMKKTILLLPLVIGLVAVLYYSIFLRFPFYKISFLIRHYLIWNGILLASILISSITSYFVIKFIPLNLSLKGKNPLFKLEKFFYLLKTMVMVLIIPTIITGTDTVYIMTRGFLQEKEYLVEIENLYQIAGIRYAFNSYDYNQFDNQINDYFSEHHGLFYKDIGYGDSKVVKHLYNSEYFPHIEFKEFGLMTVNVIIDNNNKMSKEEIIRELNYNIFDSNYSDSLTFNIYYDDLVSLVNYGAYFDMDKYISPYALITVEPFEEGTLSGQSYFYFEGTRDEAQKYFDDFLFSIGAESFRRIASVEEDYFIFKNHYIMANIPKIVNLLLAIIIYYYFTSQTLGITISINKQKIFLQQMEGKSKYSIVIPYLLIQMLVMVISGIIGVTILRLSVKSILLCFILYLIIDFIVIIRLLKKANYREVMLNDSL